MRPYLIAVLAVLVVSPLGQGFHEDIPLLRDVRGTEPGWSSYKVTTNGAHVAVDVVGLNITNPNQVFVIVHDAVGDLAVAFGLSSAGENTALQVHSQGPPGVDVQTEVLRSGAGTVGVGVTIGEAGTWKILVWQAGQAELWVRQLRGEEGVRLLAEDSGDEVWMHDAASFRGTALAQAWALGWGARVNVDTSLEVRIENRFYGQFFDGLASIDRMSVTGSDETRSCPCYFYDGHDGVSALAPGTYAFAVTGVGASQLGQIYFGGADARIPA